MKKFRVTITGNDIFFWRQELEAKDIVEATALGVEAASRITIEQFVQVITTQL